MEARQRVQFRIPKYLHKWLKDKGKQANRSMNGELVELMKKAKQEDEKNSMTRN